MILLVAPECAIPCAFRELAACAIDNPGDCRVEKGNLCGTDTDNWAVLVQKTVYCAALPKAQDMGCQPETADFCIPRTWDVTEGRKPYALDCRRKDVQAETNEEETERDQRERRLCHVHDIERGQTEARIKNDGTPIWF